MAKLEPGMNIFLGTGVGEPRTLVKHLMADVLATNKGMMKVFEKDGAPVTAKLDYSVYPLTIPLFI